MTSKVAIGVLAVAALAATASPSMAQAVPGSTPPIPGVSSPATPPIVGAAVVQPCCLLASGTPVEIALTSSVDSGKAKPGDPFQISLAKPILVGDQIVVPAGVTGGGEVVDAEGAGLGGRPGKLVLAARYLDFGDKRILLRSFRLGGSGRNTSNEAMAADITISAFVPVVGAAVFFIPGGNIVYPPGTLAMAKVAGASTLPPIQPAIQSAATVAPQATVVIPNQAEQRPNK